MVNHMPGGQRTASRPAGHVPLVFVGAAGLDAIALVPHFPRPDKRLIAEAISHAGGGPAATAAVAAARLGMAVAFVGTVGDDDAGQQIVAGLRAENVDVSGVRIVTGLRSAESIIVAESARYTRVICARPGPPPLIEGRAFELLRAADWVHVDHLGWASAWRAVRELPERARPRLSVDGGNDIEDLVLTDVDLYAPTEAALLRRYGDRRLEELVGAALVEGVGQVVVTRGGAGCVVGTVDSDCWAVPAYPATIRSTLGAGDVFHGALLAAVVRGLPLPDCADYACAAAALSCAAADGRSAIPAHRDVMAALAGRSAGAAAGSGP
jgi:sulfofructose kinase